MVKPRIEIKPEKVKKMKLKQKKSGICSKLPKI